MNLLNARRTKLEVVSLLQQAGYVKDFPLYVKADDKDQLGSICGAYRVTRVHCAPQYWPVYNIPYQETDFDDVIVAETNDDINRMADGSHACSNGDNRFVAEIDPTSMSERDTSQVVAAIRRLEDKLKSRSGYARKLQWSVGLFLRATGQFGVTVKLMTKYSLGRNAPLSDLSRAIVSAIGEGDFGAVDVSNPVTPIVSSTMTDWSSAPHDTARPGLQVSSPGMGPSTLCARVTSIDDTEHYFLASGHSLFSSTSTTATVEVQQPQSGGIIGLADRSQASFPKNDFGEIVADYALVRISDGFNSENRFDAASRRKSIVEVDDGAPNMNVYTLGAASGLMERSVKTFEAEAQVVFEESKIATCLDQFISVSDKSSRTKSGDSGGPVLVRKLNSENEFKIVGMIVAGHPAGTGNRRRYVTVFTPFSAICAIASVKLAVA